MDLTKLKTSFEDDRGVILDILQNVTINAVTLVTIRRGATRGNHYHRETTQWNYVVSGRLTLYSQVPGESLCQATVEAGDLVRIGPEERHALVGLSDSELMVFTHGPRGGKEYETDTYRLEVPLFPPTGGSN